MLYSHANPILWPLYNTRFKKFSRAYAESECVVCGLPCLTWLQQLSWAVTPLLVEQGFLLCFWQPAPIVPLQIPRPHHLHGFSDSHDSDPERVKVRRDYKRKAKVHFWVYAVYSHSVWCKVGNFDILRIVMVFRNRFTVLLAYHWGLTVLI